MKNFFNRALDNFLEEFFPDPETRSIAKKIIIILLVSVILVFLVPSLAWIIKIVAAIITTIFIITQMKKKR